MIKADKYYKEHLKEILDFGDKDKNPRPKYKDGNPAHCIFITQIFEKYNLQNNEFPITTLRNTAIKTGIKEMLWIYQHESNSLDKAKELGITWWDEWDIGDNTIGIRYGETVRRYNLMKELLNSLKNDPFSRRHILNMYQYSDMNESKGLHPCAYETMWSIREKDNKYYIDMTLVQRSNDYIMAGYINKIQYVALMMMVASHLGYELGNFCHYTHNLHIYDRHIEAANEILSRESINIQPILKLKENKDFYSFTIDDFIIENNIGQKIKSPLEIAI